MKCSIDCVCQNGTWLVPCTDPVCQDYSINYLIGKSKPNYPVPALDYYNSPNPDHMPIGYMMEWSIPVDIQLKYRGYSKPNYPVPAIPRVFEWDYSLGIMLETMPPLTDEEWEREEEAWEDYLDSLD